MKRQDFVKEISVHGQTYTLFDIVKLEEDSIAEIGKLPFSIRILVENLLRNFDGYYVKEEDLLNIAGWRKSYQIPVEIPYHPVRVLMQDFTGVPAVVDLAAMREAVKRIGGDPLQIDPRVPTELTIDHSVQVDYFGTKNSFKKNVEIESKRNSERYELLKWARRNFSNFKVVPPDSGTAHMVNLEYFGRIIETQMIEEKVFAFPDSLIGTDSHTTMINSLGILGWGVGGIEAEAVILGQPYYMTIPQVIGVRLFGELKKLKWLKPFPSQANFILCSVLNGKAKELQQKLQDKGILVRFFDTPILRNSIRISVGKPEHTDALIETLRELEEEING